MMIYRVYNLDGSMRITAVETVEANNDEEAMSKAGRLNAGVWREVWSRDRLVGRIEALQD